MPPPDRVRGWRWPRGAAVLMVMITGTMLSGCGGGGDAGASSNPVPSANGPVFPFSRVQVGTFTFEADPSRSDRAIFHVRTAQPMICAVVWGPTEKFGHFNNSLNMDGTGLIRHDVYLPGAQSGVAYRFIVQGTTADGTLYRSPVGSFNITARSTGSEPGATTYGANLARSAHVTAFSSEYSASFAASNAIDDNPNTEWASKGDGNGAFITLDLGAPTRIAAVEFLTRSMADGTAITSTYSVTVDGAHTLGPFPAGTLVDPRPSAVSVTGRTLRFQVTASSGGNTGAIEIRVLAPPG
jgi:hypothetical protein